MTVAPAQLSARHQQTTTTSIADPCGAKSNQQYRDMFFIISPPRISGIRIHLMILYIIRKKTGLLKKLIAYNRIFNHSIRHLNNR